MSSGPAAVLSHHLTSQSVLYQTILDSPSLTCCMHVYTIISPPSTTTHPPSTSIPPPSTTTHSPSTAISPLPLPPLTLHLLQFPHALYHHSPSIYCNSPTPSTTTLPPSTAISTLPLPPLSLHLLQFPHSLYHHSPSIYCNFPSLYHHSPAITFIFHTNKPTPRRRTQPQSKITSKSNISRK